MGKAQFVTSDLADLVKKLSIARRGLDAVSMFYKITCSWNSVKLEQLNFGSTIGC